MPKGGSITDGEEGRAPTPSSSRASQATGRVQPRRRPTATIRPSRAPSAEMISRTWTAPAAWRKVPQVVATGNSRLVTRKITADANKRG